ncbi:hypothetical protein AB0C12_32270 [Actinoplanes sp. NPDC048967]|uniref:hypothetical protein n=1 Tax=Actinoplanes sp. NPDC048967 TaxID=3155269 RepID=UPI0034039ADE
MRSYPELSEHELRTRLGDLAAAHEPDRAAILHRVARHRAGPPVAERPPAGQAVRLAGSALAVATILGVGGMARWALADGPQPAVTTVPAATPSAATPQAATPQAGVPSAGASPRGASPRGASPPGASPPGASPRGASPPGASPPGASPPGASGNARSSAAEDAARRDAIRADGSINPNSDDTDGRSDITLKLREPVRALELTVRVAPTAGLTDQGSTHDVTGATIETTVIRDRDALVYHFTLAGGATLRAGTYVFTARYGYDNQGGRDAGDDSYSVTAATVEDGADLKVRGDFF